MVLRTDGRTGTGLLNEYAEKFYICRFGTLDFVCWARSGLFNVKLYHWQTRVFLLHSQYYEVTRKIFLLIPLAFDV